MEDIIRDRLIGSMEDLRNKIRESDDLCDLTELSEFENKVLSSSENDDRILQSLSLLKETIFKHNEMIENRKPSSTTGPEYTNFKNDENMRGVERHYFNGNADAMRLKHTDIMYSELTRPLRQILSFSVVCPDCKRFGARLERVSDTHMGRF